MKWLIYNYPKFYDWYMNKLASWIEAYRERELIQVVDKCISNKVILDIGCGTGKNCILLSEKYPNSRIIGIDTNTVFLDHAKKKLCDPGINNVQIIEQDITNCTRGSISKDQIDVAICTLGLSVIAEWKKAIEQIISILRPGGQFIVMDLCIDTRYFPGKISHSLARLFFNAHHNRKILEKLRSSFTEIETLQIDVKPESKTSLFIFHGQNI